MNKNNEISLVSLLKDNPDYMDRIHEIANEVKKDKSKIASMAQKYNTRYETEINEGTRKRQIMIEQRVNSGKSLEEAERSIGFIPSVYTPILNWLYFFMREENNPARERIRAEQENEYKHLLHEQQEVDGMEKVPDVFVVLSGKNISYNLFKTMKKLKTLATRNDNEHEAFQAYRACIKLCNEHDINFDKIPTN